MVTQRLHRWIFVLALSTRLSWALAADSQPISPLLLPNSLLKHSSISLSNYEEVRAEWTRANQRWSFSYDVQLTAAESNIDQYLSALRSYEIASKPTNGFAPRVPFYATRERIRDRSRVYAFLRGMPKGGVLHVHSSSAGRAEWVARTAIASNCWVYWNGNTNDPGNGTLRWTQLDSNYVSIASVVKAAPNFQRRLVSLLRIDAADEHDLAWTAWSECYNRMVGLLTDPGFFLGYMVDAFESFARDNVDYVELRTDIPTFVGPAIPEGNTNCILQYAVAEQRVLANHPDFKLALIISPYRGNSLSYFSNRIDAALALRSDSRLKNFVVGFDLVGEEVPNDTLMRAIPVLCTYLQQRTNECGIALPYMFHGGESDWGNDDNLIDAVLLRSRRIGHAINLYRYPSLQDTLRAEQCPIELCPISNQLLRYTSDLRAHPGAGYLGHGLQAVLASDDPCIFGNEGLSFDFYSAYMAWSINLASLKKLATNSIAFSAQPAEEKVRRGDRWHTKWTAWINSNQAPALQYLNSRNLKP